MDYFKHRENTTGVVPLNDKAGEIVYNNKEFYEALKIVLEKGNRFIKKQEELLLKIHGDVDGKASERVARIIESILR